jgi:soluble lytic murein transglycosylase-like protein
MGSTISGKTMSTFKNGMKMALAFVGFCAIAVLLATTESKSSAVRPEAHTPEFQTAFFEAAKVYGRAGCGDQTLAEMTARNSIRTGLPPQLIASLIAVESNCNPLAVSNRGAVGLTQVVPKAFAKQYDFSNINLLNPEDSMRVGTDILSELVKLHGIKNGLARYYGTGSDGIGLGGAGYAAKVLQLAGKI